MRSRLNYPPFIYNMYNISVLNSAQTMRNTNRRPSLRRSINRLLDNTLRLRIQRARSFIKKENLWLTKQCSGDCDLLLLTAR